MAKATNSCAYFHTQTLGFIAKCAREAEKPGIKKRAYVIFKRGMFNVGNVTEDAEKTYSEMMKKFFSLVKYRKSGSSLVDDVPYLVIGMTNEDQTGYDKVGDSVSGIIRGFQIAIDPKKSEFTAKSQGTYPSAYWLNGITMSIYGSGHFQEKLCWYLMNNDAMILFQDANDDWRLIGDIDNRVNFTCELGSGQGREGETKTVITAEVESDYPPLFFEGKVSNLRTSMGAMDDGDEIDSYQECYGGITSSDAWLNSSMDFTDANKNAG